VEAVALTVTDNGDNAVILDGKVEPSVLRIHAAAVDAERIARHVAQVMVAGACAVSIERQSLNRPHVVALAGAWVSVLFLFRLISYSVIGGAHVLLMLNTCSNVICCASFLVS